MCACWCVTLELTFGDIFKAAAEAKAEAEAKAAAEAKAKANEDAGMPDEKLRKLLGDFGLENEADCRALAAFQIKTVADLHLLGREDVNEVLPMSHVSRENFVKLLEHVGAPAFLSPEENSLGRIKYCRDRAAKFKAALSAWSAKAARSQPVPHLSRMWPGEDIPSHIAGGIQAAETSHPTDETPAHLPLELIGADETPAHLPLDLTSINHVHTGKKQHQSRACRKKTASITIILWGRTR